MPDHVAWTYELPNDPSHEGGYYHVMAVSDEAETVWEHPTVLTMQVPDTPELDETMRNFCAWLDAYFDSIP